MILDVLLLVGLAVLAWVVWKVGGWWLFYLSIQAERRRDIRRHRDAKWPQWLKDQDPH